VPTPREVANWSRATSPPIIKPAKIVDHRIAPQACAAGGIGAAGSTTHHRGKDRKDLLPEALEQGGSAPGVVAETAVLALTRNQRRSRAIVAELLCGHPAEVEGVPSGKNKLQGFLRGPAGMKPHRRPAPIPSSPTGFWRKS